jgi:dihydrofolate synthase / folylpolyglutamate synthase
MQFSSLNEWLGWLETCHPQEIDLGLERIRVVARVLQLLNPTARVVTVGGTNGKGSCVAATSALLQSTGLRVGVYTSPHLLHYCERICVNGVKATEAEVCEAFEKIYLACGSVSLTYFEFGTLAALEIFRSRQVDVMVLEVGLGGRLDAVNIIDPDVAVITSIDLDHQDWLGNDRESIGQEKAGIMRSHRPVICADPMPPKTVVATAQHVSAQWHGVNETFGFSAEQACWDWWGLNPAGQRIELRGLPLPALPLPSLAAALQVINLLGLDPGKIGCGELLAHLELPGRFQQLHYHNHHFILDVAHNPAATQYLARRLQAQNFSGRIIGIVAMMADKDRSNSLGNLTHLINAWYLADLSWLPRAATPDQLAQDLQQLTVPVVGRGTVAECIEQALAVAEAEDRIVIFGSFYTVAAALAVMQPSETEQGSQQ